LDITLYLKLQYLLQPPLKIWFTDKRSNLSLIALVAWILPGNDGLHETATS